MIRSSSMALCPGFPRCASMPRSCPVPWAPPRSAWAGAKARSFFVFDGTMLESDGKMMDGGKMMGTWWNNGGELVNISWTLTEKPCCHVVDNWWTCRFVKEKHCFVLVQTIFDGCCNEWSDCRKRWISRERTGRYRRITWVFSQQTQTLGIFFVNWSLLHTELFFFLG